MTGASFDCLLDNPHASMTAWLGLSFAPPLVLWLLTMIYVVGRSMSAGSGMVRRTDQGRSKGDHCEHQLLPARHGGSFGALRPVHPFPSL